MLTPKRRAGLRRACAALGGTLEGWQGFCRTVAASAFLSGRTHANTDHSHWRCDLDLALGQEKFTRIMEGAYRDDGTGSAGTTVVEHLEWPLSKTYARLGELLPASRAWEAAGKPKNWPNNHLPEWKGEGGVDSWIAAGCPLTPKPAAGKGVDFDPDSRATRCRN